MRILLVSNRNPHFVNTNVYREKAIRKLGHKCLFFNDRDFIIPGRIRQRCGFVQNWDIQRLNKRLVRVAADFEADVAIVVGGFRTLPDALIELRRIGVKTVLWTSDAPREYRHIMATARLYDHIFCSGTEAVELFNKEGIEGVIWLPFACDPDYHKPVDLSDEERQRYARDVVFVGAFYPNRWEVLRELKEFNVGIWGPGWAKAEAKKDERRRIVDVKLNYTEWVKIYNAAKIVIVIHYQDGKTPCYQASPKVYEAMACRSFVFVDQQRDIFFLFDEGRHVVSFQSQADLKEKIRYYLDHTDERERVADEGYREVLQNHTYVHRMREILSKID